jgi:ATP-dependent RNA helicase MSS116
VGLPSSKEQYVHRLGRTARAGKQGCGVLLLADFEKGFLSKVVDDQGMLPRPNAAPERRQEFSPGIERAVGRVDEQSLALGYQAWLGFYNGFAKQLRWTREDLVRVANRFATESCGLAEPPAITAQAAGKMGLKGHPLLNIMKGAPGKGAGGKGGGGKGAGARKGGFDGDGGDDAVVGSVMGGSSAYTPYGAGSYGSSGKNKSSTWQGRVGQQFGNVYGIGGSGEGGQSDDFSGYGNRKGGGGGGGKGGGGGGGGGGKGKGGRKGGKGKGGGNKNMSRGGGKGGTPYGKGKGGGGSGAGQSGGSSSFPWDTVSL